VVEDYGEKKAAKACKEGLPCIGLGGVWSFRSKKKAEPLIEDFDEFTWEGREVLLIFDSDLSTNVNVMKALNMLSKELSGQGAFVYVLYLPYKGKEKIGLDDYLLTHSVDELLDMEYEEYEESRVLWKLNEELAIIEEIGSVMTLSNGKLHSKNTITDLLFADRKISYQTEDGMTVKAAATEWVKWKCRRSHSKLEYIPDGEETLPDNALNTWTGWGCNPKEGSTKPFFKLLDYLIDDDNFKTWFIQWLAYPLQNPGTKMYTSVLIHGIKHGTGKSLIGYIMGKIYGDNFIEVTQEDLHNNFNELFTNKQLIMGEEITGSDKRKDADRIKNMITRETINVNAKHIRQYTLKDCCNFLFTSNHPDSFFLETNDRRMAIWEVLVAPMSDEEYKKIDEWKENNGPSALFHHLLNKVDCRSFNPKSKAPETAGKAEMIQLSRSDLDAYIYSIKEDAEFVLIHGGVKIDRDLFTTQELVDMYDPEHKLRTTQIAMSKALRRAGFTPLPITQTLNGSKRLWALRNIAKWNSAEHHERVADYDKSVVLLSSARAKANKFKKQGSKAK